MESITDPVPVSVPPPVREPVRTWFVVVAHLADEPNRAMTFYFEPQALAHRERLLARGFRDVRVTRRTLERIA